MAEWTMRPVSMRTAKAEENQPLHAWTAQIGEHLVRMATTAKGYAELTGRKHPRVKAMRAAYRRRQR